MTKALILALTACVTLAACGIDGAPKPPPPKKAATPGMTVSGTVEMGVTSGG